jgi:hypothetical protein
MQVRAHGAAASHLVYDLGLGLADQGMNAPEDVDLKLMRAAHHEAAHVVIAAIQGLRLRREGVGVNRSAQGLAFYQMETGESDILRERVIIATFAGFNAEARYCEEQFCAAPDLGAVMGSPDWICARKMISKLSDEYMSNRGVATVQCEMEDRSQRLVEQNWLVISALATALLAKEWQLLDPSDLRCNSWDETTAKYLSGDDVVGILGNFGIVAFCGPLLK